MFNSNGAMTFSPNFVKHLSLLNLLVGDLSTSAWTIINLLKLT